MDSRPESVTCRALGTIRNPNRNYRPTDVAVYFNREIIESICKSEATIQRFHRWLQLALYPTLRSANEA